jgi:flavin-dependent dehydrogenase
MHDFDVAIVGGGVAGLTAALQLKDERPATSIVVFEKREHPVPDSAYKVGESIAEVAATYMNEYMDMREYMTEGHLRKFGLRWFVSNGDNSDISRRIELGLTRFSPLANYHIDRGAIENHLAKVASDRGIEFIDAAHVADIDLNGDRHTIAVAIGGQVKEYGARWVVDATGRQALLRRKLRVGIDLPIDAGASWFRTPFQLRIDEWSDDQAWRDQVPSGERWRSTISFVGEGYWIWIINLGSGTASVGVVTDPRFIPFERIRRYDALLEWLREAEPQMASKLPSDDSELLDFMKRKQFSHSCTRAFSRHRWALTGEGAVFLDPLYSTGHDLGSIANVLATDLIRRELDGENGSDFSKRVRGHNRALLGIVQLGLDVFPGMLAIYGNPQPTGAKFLWDNASYFSILLNLFRNGGIRDPDYVRSLQPMLRVNQQINSFMQAQVREWGTWDLSRAPIPVASDHLTEVLFKTPLDAMTYDELRRHVERSISRLHTMSREMVTMMCEAAGKPVPEAPYEEPPLCDEDLILWSDIEKRMRPPAEQDPQPEEGWFIR